MSPLHRNAFDAAEHPRGLHLADRPAERPDRHPSRSSDIVYRVAAMAAALFLLVTIV